jgi:hypothetical protein
MMSKRRSSGERSSWARTPRNWSFSRSAAIACRRSSERAGQRGDQALEHRDDVELGREVLERGVDGLELLGPAPNDPMHATEVIQVHQQAPDQALVHLAQVPAPRRPGPGRGGR